MSMLSATSRSPEFLRSIFKVGDGLKGVSVCSGKGRKRSEGRKMGRKGVGVNSMAYSAEEGVEPMQTTAVALNLGGAGVDRIHRNGWGVGFIGRREGLRREERGREKKERGEGKLPHVQTPTQTTPRPPPPPPHSTN
jgi:hypothetical protein